MNRDAIRPQETEKSGSRSAALFDESAQQPDLESDQRESAMHECQQWPSRSRNYYRLLQSSTTRGSGAFVPYLDSHLSDGDHANVAHSVTLSDMLLVYYRRSVEALRRELGTKREVAEKLGITVGNLDFQLRGTRQEISTVDIDAIGRLVGQTHRGIARNLADIAAELEQTGPAFRGVVSEVAPDGIHRIEPLLEVPEELEEPFRGRTARRRLSAASKRGVVRVPEPEGKPSGPQPPKPHRPHPSKKIDD